MKSDTVKYAWISGLAGAISITLIALWYHSADILQTGISVANLQITDNKSDSILAALLLCATIMFIAEIFINNKKRKLPLIKKHPGINQDLIIHCLIRYIESLILLWVIKVFYQSAGEYGYVNKHPFYRPWFMCLEYFWTVFLWAGLPYTLITRIFKYNPEQDNKHYGLLAGRLFWWFVSMVPAYKDKRKSFATMEKQVFLDLLVKMFFLPLMVVFFFQTFPALIDSIGYINRGMPTSFRPNGFNLHAFNFDIARIGIQYLFSVHLALAFAGYALSSRWLHNQSYSVDMRLQAWFVCLVTFPPFTHMLISKHVASAHVGPHLHYPSQVLEQFSSPSLITFAIVLMLAFYLVYLASTIALGMRYANLSNRGIITTGPYKIVRHPAYTAKLLGWLCVLLPVVFLNTSDNNWQYSGFLILGYAVAVLLFSLRALTEENHLKNDEAYKDYCAQVKYRFIPKII